MSQAALQKLKERFPDAVTETYTGTGGDDVALVKKESDRGGLPVPQGRIPDLAFDMAPYITAVDYMGSEPRFELVYQMYSTTRNHRIRLRVGVPESDPVVAQRDARSGRAPTGTSATAGTCTASASRGTPTCAASTCTRSSSVTRCARTTRCAAASRSCPSGTVDEPFRGPGPTGG